MNILMRSRQRSPDDPGGDRVVRILAERYGWTPDPAWQRRVHALSVAFHKLRSKQSIALYALSEYLGTLEPDDAESRAFALRALERATAAYAAGSIRRPFAGHAIIEPLEHRFGVDCATLRQAMAHASGTQDDEGHSRTIEPPHEDVPLTDQDVRFGADFVAMIDRLVARISHRSAAPSPFSRVAVVSDIEMEAFGPGMVGTILALIAIELAARPAAPRALEAGAATMWDDYCADLLGDDAVALIRRRVRRVAGLDAAND